MKNEKLKDWIDDALSGIGENPWMLRQVLARAESEENKPVKRKISFGTVLIAMLFMALMSVGIAAVTRWNVLDFLNTEIPYITAPVGKEAETDGAKLRVESVLYDGEKLAFDWTLENKRPEVPFWCYMEELTINGRDIIDHYTGDHCIEYWLPGDDYKDGIAQSGDLFEYPLGTTGADIVHIHMKVSTYRPIRPIGLVDTDKDGFGKEVEQKIAEGYFAVPACFDSDGGYVIDGFFDPEPDLNVCPEGWSIAVSGDPTTVDITQEMGGMTVESLVLDFDAVKTAPVENIRKLKTQEVYDNEYCTAVVEQADISDLGMRLVLRVTPKNDQCKFPINITLSDGINKGLNGMLYGPIEHTESPSIDKEGEMVWKFRWYGKYLEGLPEKFFIRMRMQDWTDIYFPIELDQ